MLIPGFLQANPEEGINDRSVTEFTLHSLTRSSAPRELTLMRIARERNDATVVERGILFTYSGRNVKRAQIAGDFTNWKTAAMTRGKNGIWYYFLGEYDKKETVRYKFKIDGLWIHDPNNTYREDDGNGSFVSLARPALSPESRQVSYRVLADGTIEFRHFEARASLVTIAGDFNNWNPEHDIMIRGEDNIWRLRKKLPRGKYRYKLVIDGEWTTDVYNRDSASDGVGGISSLISIK
jgi:1,4-alpha-glucan branching enzyme